MNQAFVSHIAAELAQLKSAGLYKSERVITSMQSAGIEIAGGRSVLNFCANNYLGLADNEEIREAAKAALDRYGYGMASVRFICGTQEEHKQLEARIAGFLGFDDAILYGSCFDANGGLFETLLGEDDAIISDALNHASIIDGVRLSRAKRFRYANNDMAELEERLKEAEGCPLQADRHRWRLLDGRHHRQSPGRLRPRREIRRHGHGRRQPCRRLRGQTRPWLGRALRRRGQGRHHHRHAGQGARRRLGRLYGGEPRGGRLAAPALAALPLLQHADAGVIAAASLKVFDIVEQGGALRERLAANAARFRSGMTKAGFTLAGAGHPIIPVMIGDAALAARMAEMMLERGIYVVGFSFPVVPKGQARIRTQMSAAHSFEDVDRAVEAFGEVGRALGVGRRRRRHEHDAGPRGILRLHEGPQGSQILSGEVAGMACQTEIFHLATLPGTRNVRGGRIRPRNRDAHLSLRWKTSSTGRSRRSWGLPKLRSWRCTA